MTRSTSESSVVNRAAPSLPRYFQWSSAATILLSAFLLFQVQPLISRCILPWFGGSPAVWTTCVLFFQLVLLLGYTYAHLLSTARPQRQFLLHVLLLAAACMLVPIAPSNAWRPPDSLAPVRRIITLLVVHVGLPYFLLSATGPLVQSWYAKSAPGSPYRLYAVSNAGSLAALLTYPVLVEPNLSTTTQAWVWSGGFIAFALACADVARRFARRVHRTHDATEPLRRPSDGMGNSQGDERATPTIPFSHRLLWVMLPALASWMLLAVTARVCQDIAVSPFMWIVPLSLYLLTFIICFDREQWYRPLPFATMLALAVTAMCVVMQADEIEAVYRSVGIPLNIKNFDNNVVIETMVAMAVLFFVCMVCHGEVVRRKPDPSKLTQFYLAIATGGAIGGVLVALICPITLSYYGEWNLGLFASFMLGIAILLQSLLQLRSEEIAAAGLTKSSRGNAHSPPRTTTPRPTTPRPQAPKSRKSSKPSPQTPPPRSNGQVRYWNAVVAGSIFCSTTAMIVVVWAQLQEIDDGSLLRERTFYGVLSVQVFGADSDDEGHALYNGRILHGFQYWSPAKRRTPTTYYSSRSGIGLAVRSRPGNRQLRVGVVGLGAGTIAAYARSRDHFRFYEINPLSIRLAKEHFHFLRDAPGTTTTVLGDGRISLENEAPQDFDILALDAFSGDAIPTHLLTDEAMLIYTKHLAKQGMLCVHISNRHLNLQPVVAALAEKHNFETLRIKAPGGMSVAETGSDWILLSRSPTSLQRVRIKALAEAGPHETPIRSLTNKTVLWTDQHSSLLDILR